VVSPEPVLLTPPPDTEFGRPEWQLGTSLWYFVAPSAILATFTRAGRSGLARIDVITGACTDVSTDLQPLDSVAGTGNHVIFVAGSDARPSEVIRMSLETGEVETLRSSSSMTIDSGYLSRAEAIEFPTDGGLTAHAFHYPPRNAACAADPRERPPLIVISHGGPTSAARSTLSQSIQYWTSRGFAVVDVDYGGSTGYGRAYRERLNGQWGVVDVADCVNAAKYLVAQGKADPDRLIIRGGSAGGYTTLAALTFHPGIFKAGASYYGISDLEVLELDTHKFESRYSGRLIGPYPESRDLYRARSPIHAVDRLSCPLILFQGVEDKVVPPNQARMMADALRAKGLPVALLMFEGEQHGFRKAETVIRALEAELWFYGAVFGFAPADVIEPVEVANLNRP
jgi:dipeptidyl aminopeptidase/acylaminoacyl peptidase